MKQRLAEFGSLKKLTDELKASLVKSLAEKATQALFATTKDASEKDSGTFKVIVSTADVDRQGESVNQDGWDLSFYKSNPVVLWAHDYSSLPIAMCTSIGVIDGKLTAEGKFAPASANPFAQQVRMLYDLGMLGTTSVGFIPKEFDSTKGGVINKAELLEFSFVPVPANAYALPIKTINKMGINLSMLKMKGLNIKEGEAGSRCQTDDGTPGILGPDPTDTDGPLVCIPEKSIDIHKALEVFKDDMQAEHKDHKDIHMKALEVFKTAMNAIDVSKGINVAEMDCYKEYEKTFGLEDERHSKASFDHIVKLENGININSAEGADGRDADQDGKAIKKLGDEVKSLSEKLDKFIALGPRAEGDGKGGDAGTENKGRKTSEIEELNKFLETRDYLKSIDKSLEKILRNFNEVARGVSKR